MHTSGFPSFRTLYSPNFIQYLLTTGTFHVVDVPGRTLHRRRDLEGDVRVQHEVPVVRYGHAIPQPLDARRRIAVRGTAQLLLLADDHLQLLLEERNGDSRRNEHADVEGLPRLADSVPNEALVGAVVDGRRFEDEQSFGVQSVLRVRWEGFLAVLKMFFALYIN